MENSRPEETTHLLIIPMDSEMKLTKLVNLTEEMARFIAENNKNQSNPTNRWQTKQCLFFGLFNVHYHNDQSKYGWGAASMLEFAAEHFLMRVNRYWTSIDLFPDGDLLKDLELNIEEESLRCCCSSSFPSSVDDIRVECSPGHISRDEAKKKKQNDDIFIIR